MTSGEITHAAWLRSRGRTFREISVEMGFGEETIRCAIHRHPLLVGGGACQFEMTTAKPETLFLNVVRANVLHLMDIKNAGHSPARTELCIGPDSRTLRPRSAPLRETSFIGSPGASCAEA